MVEITDRETHTKKWLGSFHTTKLATLEYDRWQVRFHSAAACLNFQWGRDDACVELVPPPPGVVNEAMAQEDREVRECLEAEAVDEKYMADLRRRYPKLVEAERVIFLECAVDGEVIFLSDDEEPSDDSQMWSSMLKSGGASSLTPATTTRVRTQWTVECQGKIGSPSTRVMTMMMKSS